MSNKIKYRIAIIFILFILFISSPYYLWKMTPYSDLKVMVIDKTVPVDDYREHRGLFWILDYLKINNTETQQSFDYTKDYYGYFPTTNGYTTKEIKSSKDIPNLIYLADTYGVYRADLNSKNVKGKRSSLIYGGLTEEEVAIVESQLVNNTTVISEFNTLNSPTTEGARKKMENIFGIHWENWIGRYFRDLSQNGEVPDWAIKAYERQTNKQWEFTGAGIMYASSSDEIIVLESKKDLINDAPTVSYTANAAKEFSATSSIPYYYWFEVNSSDELKTETLASYTLSLSEAGKEKLDKYKLPITFPAIVKNKNSFYTSYYFSGDFVDNKNISSVFQLKGLDKLKKILASPIEGDMDEFFWKCYVPMMEKIINQIVVDKNSH